MGNNIQPLSDTIRLTGFITKNLIDKWNTAIPVIMKTTKLRTMPVEPVTVRRYRYDFYGLLLFLSIPIEYHYVYLRVNGYTAPTQFKGDKYTITLLDNTILSSYHAAFIR